MGGGRGTRPVTLARATGAIRHLTAPASNQGRCLVPAVGQSWAPCTWQSWAQCRVYSRVPGPQRLVPGRCACWALYLLPLCLLLLYLRAPPPSLLPVHVCPCVCVGRARGTCEIPRSSFFPPFCTISFFVGINVFIVFFSALSCCFPVPSGTYLPCRPPPLLLMHPPAAHHQIAKHLDTPVLL